MTIVVDASGRTIVGLVTIPFVVLNVLDGFWKPALLKTALIVYWAYDIGKWVVLPIVMLWILHRATATSPQAYGLKAELGLKDLLLLLPLPLITLSIAYAVGSHLAGFFMPIYLPTFQPDSPLRALGQLALFGTLYFSVTAGFCESVFFIGLPWLWFSRGGSVTRQGTVVFVLVTAVLFGVSHFENGSRDMLGAFAFQLIAFYWYFRLGTLWPVIGAHALIDLYLLWPSATI